MFKCKKCGVNVRGTPKYCPLCQGDLTGGCDNDNNNVFPYLPILKPHKTLYSWMVFAAITTSVICAAINLSFHSDSWWSLFVMAGIGSMWLSLTFVVRKRKNIPKSILWQVALISALAYLWDKFTGNTGWSTDYVIPILCTCAMIAMAVVARVMNLDIRDYMIYLVIDSFFGILSSILILINYLDVVYPSAICFAASLISLAALISFEGKALWSEIQRRMHF